MTFHSILNILPVGDAEAEMSEPPAYFADLNLDQIVASITAGKQEYNLAPFFHEPLHSREAIEYRQEVMRDLEHKAHFDAITGFANTMRSVREHLGQAGKMHYKYQKEAWLLDAVELYCRGVENLLSELREAPPSSSGLLGFFTFLDGYVASPAFQQLLSEIATLKARLSSIRYTLLIGAGVITVSGYHEETDYGVEIQADFEKFKQGAAADHIFKFRDFEQMNHIEAGVLDRVALLYPDIFAELDDFAARSKIFFDPTILRFDREVQFYIAYIAHMRHIGSAGLKFCYPRVSAERKEICVTDGYDLALAKLLVDKHLPIVTNDFFLRGTGADHHRIRAKSGWEDNFRPDVRSRASSRVDRLPGSWDRRSAFLIRSHVYAFRDAGRRSQFTRQIARRSISTSQDVGGSDLKQHNYPE